MKFLVYKKFTEISGNKINDTDFSVKDQKVIELTKTSTPRKNWFQQLWHAIVRLQMCQR